MTRDLTYHISGADTGIKIEEYLKQLGCSHHVLTHLKRTEHGIVLNGAWAYASQRLSEGDLLQLHITEEACSEQIVPVRLPLRIVYEDADLMVIDKPADMPIHPSVNNHDNTLANAVMYYFSEQNLPFVYRCVNRLDRDTSGLLDSRQKSVQCLHPLSDVCPQRNPPALSGNRRGRDASLWHY